MSHPIFGADADDIALERLPGDPKQRKAAAAAAAAMGLPSIETEEWRYSKIEGLSAKYTPVLQAPSSVEVPSLAALDHVVAKLVLLDGFLIESQIDEGWAAKGLKIDQNEHHVFEPASTPTVFDHLHAAYSPATVSVSVPDDVCLTGPIIVQNLQVTPQGVSFPHLVIRAGRRCQMTLLEYQGTVSQAETTNDALSIPRCEVIADDDTLIDHVVIQNHENLHWQIAAATTLVGQRSTYRYSMAAFGAHYSRLRSDARLVGNGGSVKMAAAYYTSAEQVHDFRIFIEHEEPNTNSDLLFKGVQDDRSGSIFTGVIHIHENGAGSNAFQTNRNVKLSDQAWAWSVPNLEIENNEVRCSHASTVSPVDDEQRFFLQTRGVTPSAADQLIVSGFLKEVIDEMHPAVAELATAEVKAKLDARSKGIGADASS